MYFLMWKTWLSITQTSPVLNSQCFDRIKVAVRIYFYKMALAVCHRTGIVRASAGSPPTSWLTLHSLWSASYFMGQGPTGVGCAQLPATVMSAPRGSHGHPEGWHSTQAACRAEWPAVSSPSYHVWVSAFSTTQHLATIKIKNKLSWKTRTPYSITSK